MEHSHNDKPSDFLVENVHLLPRGRVLDIAMGSGRNAVYLAGLGFEVEGVDISSGAVNEALAAAERAGARIRAQTADLEKGYRIEPGAWDVIICFNYLQRSLMPQIREGLRYGGIVVYETFIADQAHFGKPRSPDHLLLHNELLDIFRDFRCLRYREGIFPGPRAAAGIVAERTGGTGASS